jgi:predicted transcriptional regulator
MATKRDKARPKKRLHSMAIRLDDEMRDQLRQIADEQGRPLANLMVFALREWLADYRAKKSPPQ